MRKIIHNPEKRLDAYNVIFSKVKFPSTVPSTKDEMFAAPSCECTRLMGLSLLINLFSSPADFSINAMMCKENGGGKLHA